MIIENYSEKYYEDVSALVESFQKEAINEFEGISDTNTIMATIREFGEKHSQNSFLLILNGKCEGVLAGIEYKSMTNGKRIFQEVIWYVNENFRKHGVKLLRKVEEILKERGIDLVIMAVLENSKTEKIKNLYTRLGYKPMEAHYIRSL